MIIRRIVSFLFYFLFCSGSSAVGPWQKLHEERKNKWLVNDCVPGGAVWLDHRPPLQL